MAGETAREEERTERVGVLFFSSFLGVPAFLALAFRCASSATACQSCLNTNQHNPAPRRHTKPQPKAHGEVCQSWRDWCETVQVARGCLSSDFNFQGCFRTAPKGVLGKRILRIGQTNTPNQDQNTGMAENSYLRLCRCWRPQALSRALHQASTSPFHQEIFRRLFELLSQMFVCGAPTTPIAGKGPMP